MRNALKPGTIITVNGVEYTIKSLLNANGGMSLIYEATQRVDQGGFAGNTVIKEFFPTTLAARNGEGRVICTSEDPEELRRFEELRRSMVDEGVIGEEARVACSQVYAFDHAEDGYAVMRKFSEDTRSLVDLLNAWQVSPPTSDEEYTDMARLRYALRICHSILTGLQTIHDRAGIIHRDISLGNIVWASSDITKEGKDGRAYFLDFGSALKMNERREARNTTDPLKLFGTYSFAAPEIWQLGATLTPAVDLFSISAILLLLCCGKKCCIRMKQGWHLASQANAGRLYESDFVVKGAVEKLNIPAEIRGMLMDFLLEGLSKAPERRFNQSPAAMLEALERLQIKCTPRQRLREYAAFISYHHRPLDKAVARRLHRMIERYRIPAELAKDQESRKLGLVFRDEDELPVSTDLTDNIQEALDHSDYLIVICTPGTPKSIWVEAEIAYFLRHHDRNHVLAVLAEGRPEESFPPHLVHLYDTEGNIIGDTEYLAANIAANSRQETLRRLNREKLRIIAAMLGCPYDSLYQREKRKQIKRGFSITCLGIMISLVYIVMLINRNNEIIKKTHEIQLNESRLLVDESLRSLENNDCTAALRNALLALPSGPDDDRPFYAPAESILYQVLGVYDSNTDSKEFIGEYTMDFDTPILMYELDASHSVIIALDLYGMITAKDIKTGEVIWEGKIQPDDMQTTFSTPYSKIQLCDQGRSVIGLYDCSLVCFSALDGREKWRNTFDYAIEALLAISNDGKYLATIIQCNTEYEESIPDLISDYDLVVFNTEDGTLVKRINIVSDRVFLDFRVIDDDNSVQNGVFYHDNQCFAGCYYEDDGSRAVFYTVDFSSETCRVVYTEPSDWNARVIYLEVPASDDKMLILTQAPDYSNAARYVCVDISSGVRQWETTVSDEELDDSYFQFDVEYHVLSGNSSILLSAKDQLYGLSKETGEVFASVGLFDTLTDIQWIDDSSCFSFVLSNGYYAVGYKNNSGFYDSRSFDCSFNLDANTSAKVISNGFIVPVIDGGVLSGFSQGTIKEGYGYVIVMPSDSSRSLKIMYMLANVGLGDVTTLKIPGEDTYLENYKREAIHFQPENVIITEKNYSSNGGYTRKLFDRQTHALIDTVSYSLSDSLYDIYYCADGSGIVVDDHYAGCIMKQNFDSDLSETLSDLGQIEVSRSFNSVFNDYVVFGDNAAETSTTYRSKDANVLTAVCDNVNLYLWLDGKELDTIPLPEDLTWQVNLNYEMGRLIQAGSNGCVVLSNYDSDVTMDKMKGFAVYDTTNRKWFYIDDPVHESSKRLLAMGESSPLFASYDSDGVIRVYDLTRSKLMNEIALYLPEQYIKEFSFVLNDDYILLRAEDGRLTLYQTTDGKIAFDSRLDVGTYPHTSVETSPDKRRVIIIDSGNNQGLVLDSEKFTELVKLEGVYGYDPTTDEMYLYNSSIGLFIRKIPDIWDTITIGQQAVAE